MQTIGNVISKMQDGYLAVVGWVATHPHVAIWSASAAIAVALVP